MNDKPKFAIGDLVRADDWANANTIYRVVAHKRGKYPHGHPEHLRFIDIIVRPVFGLFKQDYKNNKNISRGASYIKIELLDLCVSRNALDLFISQETKRLSGEK
mgnify:CR=1 FL=1